MTISTSETFTKPALTRQLWDRCGARAGGREQAHKRRYIQLSFSICHLSFVISEFGSFELQADSLQYLLTPDLWLAKSTAVVEGLK
jgi:hypothetical protein